MRLPKHGTSTSDVEIINVSQQGIRVRVTGVEYKLQYTQFPWFAEATMDQLSDVRLLHETHLYWESLDVDLDLQSIENPEDYPLIAK